VDSEILRAEYGGEYSDMSSDVAVALGVPKRAGSFGVTTPRAPDVGRCRAPIGPDLGGATIASTQWLGPT
jgi:hypothetical protein